MSLFPTCITCNEIAENVCKCSCFVCDTHAISHIKSQGEHSIQVALDPLSSKEISCLRETLKTYQHFSIREALLLRSSIIDKLLRKIKKAEEECSSLIESTLNGPIAREIEQVISKKSLPLFSQSSFVKSLVHIKQSQNWSEDKILESLRSVLPTLKSSLNKFSSSFQTLPQTTVTDETKWELLKQKNDAHADSILSIAISDCKRHLASGSVDKMIKVWDLKTLDLIRTLQGHERGVRSVRFLGNKVVSGSADKTIKIWGKDQCLKTLNLHLDWVTSVCVSSCKRLIVSGSNDKTIVVYSLEIDDIVHTLTGHSDCVLSVALSTDNKKIVSGSSDKSLKVWKTETGELLKTLNGHSDLVSCVALFGKFIASCSADKTVRIWNRKTGEALFNLVGHTGRITKVDAKNNLIVSLGADNKIIAWNATTGTIIQQLKGHGNYDSNPAMGLKSLEGGNIIVPGGKDRNINIWRRIN